MPAHRMSPASTARSIPTMMGRLGRGCWISAGTSSTTAGDFGGILTGLPHFRQYWGSSGRGAPHLAHSKRTLVTGGVELLEGILTGCSPFNRSANPDKICGAHSAGGSWFLTQKCQQILAQVSENRYPLAATFLPRVVPVLSAEGEKN